jgi:hypothetical protein
MPASGPSPSSRPSATRSPSNPPPNTRGFSFQDSSAPRRRSTPGGATKQLPARRYLAISRWKAASPPSLHGRRAPQAPSTRTRLGVPACGRSAWWPGGRMPAAPRHPVHVLGQCPVSGASDQCPRLPVHRTGVQCPVRASERPGVRRPVSVLAASAVSGRSEVLERGGGAGSRMAGMAGVGVVARCVHARLVVCLSRRLVLEAGAGGAGPAEASVWTWPSSWEVVGQWPARPRGRPG